MPLYSLDVVELFKTNTIAGMIADQVNTSVASSNEEFLIRKCGGTKVIAECEAQPADIGAVQWKQEE